jgi:hypothetical protein
MSNLVRAIVSVAAALSVLGAWTAGSASSSPGAGTSANCNISGKERHLGPTYVTSLRVKGVGCNTGERLVKQYYQCRVKSGGRRGRCHSKISGFSCQEKRIQAIKTEFDARVTCKRGRSRVWHTYTQFT